MASTEPGVSILYVRRITASPPAAKLRALSSFDNWYNEYPSQNKCPFSRNHVGSGIFYA
jgi:hypothetical protein